MRITGFATRAIHVGQEPDPATRSVVPPLVATSTYAHKSVDEELPYIYTRGNAPTLERWERCIASLEKGSYALAYASGMSAIAGVFSLLKKGDRLLLTENIYGGTYRLVERVLRERGIEVEYIPTWDLGVVKKALQQPTRMIFLETPTNPLMRVSDIKAISRMKNKDCLLVVDNTFLSPYFQRPLELGADLVVHSATKYLGGHSDLVSGVVIMNSEEIYNQLDRRRNTEGPIPGAFDCWLLLRSIKTLKIRMRQHDANARKIVEFFECEHLVEKVYYPGISEHPDYKVACRQQITEDGEIGFGGMLSVEFATAELAKRFIDNLKIFTIAESLGGVESLVGYPFTMSHGSVPVNVKRKIGIGEGMVRFSIGLEEVDDLLADLENSIKRLT